MSDIKKLHEIAQPIFTTDIFIMHDDELLMFKRSEDKKTFPGFWALPGGHIDENEDPLAGAIREVREETGVTLTPNDMKLKVIALHNHIDRKELYVVFIFVATLPKKVTPSETTDEGTPQWIPKNEALTKKNVFEPIRYYFPHVLGNKPGILYNMSEWKNAKLVRIMSETIDTNY